MALIVKKQCGDILSVPVENSTLNHNCKPQSQATTILPPGSAGLSDQEGAAEALSRRNDTFRREGVREGDSLSSSTGCSEWWGELTGGGS